MPHPRNCTYLQRLALLMAVNCVRNTVIEDYHARGSLSQAEMKEFNQEVANKIYTFLTMILDTNKKGWQPDAAESFYYGTSWFFPHDWDIPEFLSQWALDLIALGYATNIKDIMPPMNSQVV